MLRKLGLVLSAASCNWWDCGGPKKKAAGLLTNTAGKTGAKFGIEALGEAGADISQRLAAGEQFSLAMLGVSFGTSLLGGAGGEALNGAFGKLGAKLGVNKIDNAALKIKSKIHF